MMIYGFKHDLLTIVAAAATVGELKTFYQTARTGYVSRPTTLMDAANDLFQCFKHLVYIFDHQSPAQQDDFISKYDIAIHGRNFCIDRHNDMLAEAKVDIFDQFNDPRTIEERHGLQAQDNWDHRSDDQKTHDAAMKQHIKDMKASGELSGDSFTPTQKKKKDGLWITDVHAQATAEGVVDNIKISAVKDGGEIDNEEVARKAAEKLAQKTARAMLPRPWNDAKAKARKLTKSYSCDEFIMCGAYTYQNGTVVTIQPRSYFEAHRQRWSKPLHIDHLLPADMKEVAPGRYHSGSRDWIMLSHDLAQRGFKESLLLQIFLNNE